MKVGKIPAGIDPIDAKKKADLSVYRDRSFATMRIIKGGSARFLQLIGHFKLFVDCYCKRMLEVLYF